MFTEALNQLSWDQVGLVYVAVGFMGYAAFNLLALAWRVSNRVQAQAELYEAKKEWYEAQTRKITGE